MIRSSRTVSACGGESVYRQLDRTRARNGLQQQREPQQALTKESSMKMIFAALLAGAFLISFPVKAADKADDSGKTDKADKPGKKAKADKGDKADKKSDKPASGGGW
jgi:hypothetical protein